MRWMGQQDDARRIRLQRPARIWHLDVLLKYEHHSSSSTCVHVIPVQLGLACRLQQPAGL